MSFGERIYRMLKVLELKPNEVRVYLTLIEKGALSAKEASWLSGVPESRIYDVLTSLEKSGWIISERGRPKKFKPLPPEETLRRVKIKKQEELERIETEIIEELQPFYNKRSEAERPDVWILRGEDKVIAKIKAMLGKAEKNVLVTLPTITSEILDLIYPVLQVLKDKGVTIKVLVTSLSSDLLKRINRLAEVKIAEQLFGGGVIVDLKEVVIVLVNPIVGIWSDHLGLASISAGYFEYLWALLD
ncbi:MAG: TrmB family transcriptional regulator [Promethearchaeota archaeon]